MDKYITRAELRLEPYDLKHELFDNKYLEVLQQLTYDVINNACGQTFEKYGETGSEVEVKVDGLGKNIIFLPKRLISLDKIRMYTATNSYYDYEADNFEPSKFFIEWSEMEDSPRVVLSTGSTFPKGTKNIGIWGGFGWEEYPSPIKYAQGKMIQKIAQDKAIMQKFESFRVGDFSYTSKEDKAKVIGEPEIDTILRQYRRVIGYGVSGA
jgi:hypothetical protein